MLSTLETKEYLDVEKAVKTLLQGAYTEEEILKSLIVRFKTLPLHRFQTTVGMHRILKRTGSPKVQYRLGLMYEEMENLEGADIWLSVAKDNDYPCHEELNRVTNKKKSRDIIPLRDMKEHDTRWIEGYGI